MQEKLINLLPNINIQIDNDWIKVDYKDIPQVISILKSRFNFCQLIDITAVDTLNDTFDILYILRNLEKNSVAYVKTICHGSAYSITNIFKNADLYECEIYEMFGIRFINHPNLRTIFSNSLEYPLRKSNG